MIRTRTAKLLKCGTSQSSRLPTDFRFEGEEVFITRVDATGDILLSTRPCAKAWAAFFELLRIVGASDDFMSGRPLNPVSSARGVFDDEVACSSPRKPLRNT